MVTLQSNGKWWVARWRTSAGGEKFKNLGRKDELSKAAANRLILAINVEHANNPASKDVGRAPRLSKWREDYFRLRTDLGPSTENIHAVAFDRLAEFLASDLPIDEITRARAGDFRGWLERLAYYRGDGEHAKAHKLSPASIRKQIATVKQIMERARAQDLIPYNPFDRETIGEAPASEWRYIPESDLDLILGACPNDSWRLGFMLARLAGLRLNEIERADWSWINWEKGTIAVERKGRKDTTKSRNRVVPLQARLYAALEAARAQGPICPDLAATRCYVTVTYIILEAKVKWYSKPWHSLRKSLESDWLAKHPIPDVAKWLGHSPEVAMKFYHKTKTDSIEAVTGLSTNSGK